MRRAIARPPHTNVMITIMVIQVAVVIKAVPFDCAVACWAVAAEEGPRRECRAGSAFSGAGLRC